MRTINFWFDGWQPILRIVVVGTLAYAGVVILVRASGKRTLARMNAFDFIITVALGASLGRVLTAEVVPLAEAVTAFGLLVTLQLVVTSLRMRLPWLSSAVVSEPSLLYLRGRVLDGALRRERVNRDELEAAVRKEGFASLDDVEAVVLESDGRLSVVARAADAPLVEGLRQR